MPQEKESHGRRAGRRAPAGPEPSSRRLAELLEQAGTPLGEEQVRALWEFHTLLRLRNRDLNMTRIHNFENVVLKHYVDSILASRLIQLPSPLLDIGSGAGFPGIPIKIAQPRIRLVLAEGRGRRVAFLEEAVRRLGLKDVTVYGHKVGPGRNPSADLHVAFGGVITRALEDAAATLDRVAPFLQAGAKVVLMKGPESDAELAAARERTGGAFRLAADIPYTLAATPHRRRLVVFERTGLTAAESRRGALAGAAAAAGFSGAIKEVASAANPAFRRLLALQTSKGIRKEGLALISGPRPVAEVLAARPDLCRGWVTAGAEEALSGPARSAETAAPPAAAPAHLTWYRFSRPLFRQLDAAGTSAPLLLAGLPDIAEWDGAEPLEGCTLLVPFQDPENVGAVIRTAAALGAARVVLLAEAAHPFLPKSQRAAGSALYRVPLLSGPSIQDLAPGKTPLLTLTAAGRDISRFRFPDSFLLLAGMEGPGLPEALRQQEPLAIAMEPGTESLNAAAAVAVALYAWRLGRK